MSDIDFNERILSGDLSKSGYSEQFGELGARPSMGRSSFWFGNESETDSIVVDEQCRMSQGVGAIKLKQVKVDIQKAQKGTTS